MVKARFLVLLIVFSYFLSPVGENPSFAADKARKLNPATKVASKALMQKKLHAAQSLLTGLALEDYTTIQKNGAVLTDVAKASKWHNSDKPNYDRYFNNFLDSTQYLMEQAKDKNLEGVSMGYIRLTLTCMQCHNFVRENRK